MSEQNNVSNNSEQILSDIQSLQTMEKQIFNNLENNQNLTQPQKQEMVEKMNQLSNMRINLYQTLGGVNGFYENALNSSTQTLQEQTVAIGIVEKELNRSKKELELLEIEKNNKIRLIEINDYYGEKYTEHSALMKVVIFMLVPVIILAVLNNKGILPSKIYYALIAIISIIGGYFFWRIFASIITRDNMNYQTYDWYFDSNAAATATTSTTSSDDPWHVAGYTATCSGAECCSTNQTFDSSSNLCVDNSSTTESFLTEGMVNSVLTKTQTGKYKPDYNMSSNIQGHNSKSFINNSQIK